MALKRLLITALILPLTAALSLAQTVRNENPNYRDFTGLAAPPANPAGGKYRVFVDNTGAVKVVNSAGTVSTVGVTVPGSNTQVIYNDSGALGASANFVWDNSNTRLGVGGAPSFLTHIQTSGTNVPGLVVDVGGGSYASGIRLRNFGATTREINLGFDGSTLQIAGLNAGAGGFRISGLSNNLIFDTDGSNQVRVSPGGTLLGTFRTDASPNLLLTAANAAHVPLQISGAASQSADSFQVLDSDGTHGVGVSVVSDTPILKPVGSTANLSLYLNSKGTGNVWLVGNLMFGENNGTARSQWNSGMGFLLATNRYYGFTSSSTGSSGSVDATFQRKTAGLVELNSGTAIGTTVGNARDFLARYHYAAEASADPSAADLTIAGSNTLDAAATYVKNNKFVIAYNNAGTVTFISIPLDGSTTTWTHSTSAP
jgi:hypothetical protein